jgi:hypothetical protein
MLSTLHLHHRHLLLIVLLILCQWSYSVPVKSRSTNTLNLDLNKEPRSESESNHGSTVSTSLPTTSNEASNYTPSEYTPSQPVSSSAPVSKVRMKIPPVRVKIEERLKPFLAKHGKPASKAGNSSVNSAANLSNEDRRELFLIRRQLSKRLGALKGSRAEAKRQKLIEARKRLPTYKEDIPPEMVQENKRRINSESHANSRMRKRLGVHAVPLKKPGRSRASLAGVPDDVRKRREWNQQYYRRKQTKKAGTTANNGLQNSDAWNLPRWWGPGKPRSITTAI